MHAVTVVWGCAKDVSGLTELDIGTLYGTRFISDNTMQPTPYAMPL